MVGIEQRGRVSRLLIVDDNQAQLRTLTDIMRVEGFEVVACPTASEALEHLVGGEIAVAVVDLRLPDLSGTQLLEKLQSLSGSVHVVIHTAYSSYESARDALNLGAFAYVEKAGDPDQLVHHVHRAFEAHLERYARDLESAVLERTRELEEAFKELRQEMADRKRAEEGLRESESRLAMTIECTGLGWWDQDFRTGRVIRGDNWMRMLGYEPGEIEPHHSAWGQLIHPDEKADIDKCVRDHELGLTPIFSVEHRLRAKSGQWKWIRNWGKIVERDENGKPLRALGLHLDIDESKAVEEKLHRAEAQLAHAGRLSAMGEMVAGVAHEVNQPLYAIQNFSKASRNVLAAGDSPNLDDLRQWNDEIATAAAQAGEILDRLRNYARKSEPRRVCVCPCDLIGEAVELLAFEARQRQIAVDFERCETPLFAHADPLQIQEVLVNLMRNAYEATEEGDHGSPRITIRTRPAEEFVEISVADNGPGLRPMEQSNIFDPFVTTKPDGLGMGLAISRSIIEAHDGRLWADSNPEGGATFLFTLPVRNDGPDCRASAIRGRTDVD